MYMPHGKTTLRKISKETLREVPASDIKVKDNDVNLKTAQNAQRPRKDEITLKEEGNRKTYAFVDLWLVGSCLTASSFSSSSLLRREPGTDFEGSLSSMMRRDCMMPDCEDVS
jgi:hypothetical protein